MAVVEIFLRKLNWVISDGTFLVYLAAINIVAAFLCAADKASARTKTKYRRIGERTLFIVSLIGGSPVMYLSMRMIHHKTHHKRFMIGLPVMMVIQLIVFIGYVWFFT